MTTLTEGRHTADFIMSEANGHRSRAAGHIAAGNTVTPGMVLKLGTAATSDEIGIYTQLLAATGNAAVAIAIYAAAPVSGDDVDIALLVRDAEVNGKMLTWPTAITLTEKAAAITALAALGIIIR